MTDLVTSQTRYARSGNINIAYQVVGQELIDILIVGGSISHVELVYELPGCISFLQRLSRFARIVHFDKRGQGLSDRVSGVPSLEERMDDVRAVLDAVGSRKTVLVGFSEGCAMSTLFAATYPERVSHLVLVGGYIRSALAALSDSEFEAIADMIVGSWGSGQMMKRVVGAADDNADVPARLGRFERMSCSPGAIRTLLQMNRLIDIAQILSSVRIPTLVLHSRADAVAAISEGRKLAAAIPDTKYIEYDDVPHAGFTADNQALVDDIEEFITGHRSDAAEETDRVLATVLFTDIVNSTVRAVEIGDRRWRELLDSHDRLARQTVAHYRGKIVKNTGDGILATFDGPGRGVRCALALGAAAGQIGLPLRAGLHTGEIEMRGDDVGGVAVHVAARVMGQSGANEVFVSRVVTDLVAGAGLKFAERGSFSLKGIPGSWDLFAAGH